MAKKMLHSTQQKIGINNSSHLASSIYDNDFLELVWENGRIVERGPSSRTRKGPSCNGYSLKPSNAQEDDGDTRVTKRARLNTEYNELKLIGKAPLFSTHGNGQIKISTTRQIPVPMDEVPVSNLQNQGSRLDHRKTGKLNSSHLPKPAVLQSACLSSCSIQPTSSPFLSEVEKMKPGKYEIPQRNKITLKKSAVGSRYVHETTVIEPTRGSKTVTGFQNQPDSMASKAGQPVPVVAKTWDSLPDEQSEACGCKDALPVRGSHTGPTLSLAKNRAKGKPNTELLLASSSVCSLGASNYPAYSLKMKYVDTEESTYLSENDEEPEVVIKEGPASGGARVKRIRNTDIHNLSEKKRRAKINKKLHALQELIPNSNKMDEVSMLDKAIEYLKTLQLQLQIMSMGTRLYVHPMMVPAGLHHINLPNLTQFSPMGAGMGLRTGMGSGNTCIPAQFPSPQVGPTALSGITENGVPMLGFPGQVLPTKTSHAPLILGKSSTQSVLAPNVPRAPNLMEQLNFCPHTF
ncbi:Transcription factor like [Quillaja saponaria]|uniref:Transcription factor like n=1 Tax=Quillaja saponaria TaxID=32244 RepID=A0AAD7QA54_QUISA|nr:Transcription factor like [Quillaja saponaria]